MQSLFSIAAVTLAVLFALYLLVGVRERKLSSYVLGLALLLAASLELTDYLATVRPDELTNWKWLSLAAEGLMIPAWLLYSSVFAREGGLASLSTARKTLLGLSVLLPCAAIFASSRTIFFSPDFVQERILFLENFGFVYYIAILAILIIALINLEATLANATHGSRWKIKLEIVGSGVYLASLIFYYSQGLLYRTINMQFLPVRSLLLAVAVSLVGYSRFTRGNGVKVAISKQIAYKSLVLLVVGLYLVGLGLMGEGMKHFGEPFQKSVAIALAFAAAAGLLIVLLSGTVKRKIVVFVNKNFYQNKYDYREQWLQFTRKLAATRNREELLSAILVGFIETFGMACGALFLYQPDRQGFLPAVLHEIDPSAVLIPRRNQCVAVMVEKGWVVDLREFPSGFDGQILSFMETNRGVFLVPLFMNDSLDGFVFLGKQLDRSEVFNFEDFDLMKAIASQAASAILNQRLSERLAEEREMAAIGRVSAFITHDLKNLVYTVSLIHENAKEYISDPEFQEDMLESLGNTVAQMKSLITRLKSIPEGHGFKRESTDLFQLARETVEMVPGGNISLSGDRVVAPVDRDEMRKVALNLIVNAMDATSDGGTIAVEVGRDGDAFIRVSDNGCGISEDFLLNELFSPFKTTKNKGLGIGLYQCRQIVEGHGGRIEVASEPGKGSVFTVWVPVAG